MEQDELIQRREELVQRISVLEWDKGRQQIHLGHVKRLEELKAELSEIESNLNQEKSVVFTEDE